MTEAFNMVYPLAMFFLALLAPVAITAPTLGRSDIKVRHTKNKANRRGTAKRTVRKYKKVKAKKWFKAPKLTSVQQAEIERYRLGGNRLMVSVGGDLPK